MSLQSLCEDILNLICANLDNSTNSLSLRNLGLTCHDLHLITRRYTPREIRISIPSTKLTLLERTLYASSSSSGDYRNSVHELVLLHGAKTNDQDQERFAELLNKLPHLRRLEIGYDSGRYIDTLLENYGVLRESLRSLQLSFGFPLSPSGVIQLVSYSQLESLEMSYFRGHEVPLSPSPPGPNSKLRHLHLNAWNSCTKASVLQRILQSCSSLTTLITAVPYNQQQFHMERVQVESNRTFDALSPASCVASLIPVARTLTRLNLRTELNEWWGWDGTRIDLSAFIALKDLRAPSCLFFGPDPPGSSRNGFYKRLPQSLEKLMLEFCSSTGIFYATVNSIIDPTGRLSFRHNEIDTSTSTYEWISELAYNKRMCFPSLKDVYLGEATSVSRRVGVWEIEEWELPVEVKEVFGDARIELAVRVMRKKGS